ncbi:transglutaminase domain-containing protein [Rhodopirellula sp. MGV]|uniref:transglutaminase domain-containing protein n=1 Tax=Rhodopirellula sp. MGV TaxID=2023130 RepID=UPI0013041835|nr:transglutaminase domain-containing protein [Rhodopirellula sp. MGV]
MRRVKILQSLCVLSALVGCLSVGCDRLIPPRPPIGQPKDSGSDSTTPESDSMDPSLATSSESNTDTDQANQFEGNWQAWYLHRMGRQVVGMSTLSGEEVIDEQTIQSGEKQIRYEREDHLIVRNNAMQYLQITNTSSTESPAANLLSLRSESLSGFTTYNASAARRSNRLAFRFQVSGAEPTTQDVVWADGMHGPFGIEQSLRRQMLQSGETRRIEGLNSTLGAVAVFELRCTGLASVSMFDGTYVTLNEVEVTTFINGRATDDQVLWLTDDGHIEKTLRPLIRLESFRVERAVAMEQFDAPITPVLISAEGRLVPAGDRDPAESDSSTTIDTSQLTRVGFVVTTLSGEHDSRDGLVPHYGNQATKSIANGQQVLVSTQPNDLEGFEREQPEPTDEDLAPTKLIESDHPALAKMANQTASGQSQIEMDFIVELARAASNRTTLAPQGPLQSASTSLRKGAGGEIDQAILLAALLRARQVPSRIVLGLVPTMTQQSASSRTLMKLTGWTLVSIDGQWFSIDPLSLRVNPADHLAVNVIEGTSEISPALRETFALLGDVQIQIRGAR